MGLDPLICIRCATPMLILAFISDPGVAKKILDHLKIPTDVAPAPLAPRPGPSQTVLDVCAREPDRDRTANSSWGPRGPPAS